MNAKRTRIVLPGSAVTDLCWQYVYDAVWSIVIALRMSTVTQMAGLIRSRDVEKVVVPINSVVTRKKFASTVLVKSDVIKILSAPRARRVSARRDYSAMVPGYAPTAVETIQSAVQTSFAYAIYA